MPQSNSVDRFQSPPPLPPALAINGSVAAISADRRRLSTETSATSGWAARLALLFPDKSMKAPVAAPPIAAAPPRVPGSRFSTCS